MLSSTLLRQSGRSVRHYATTPSSGPNPGAHPPPLQGGSRLKGTRTMLFASVAILASASAMFLFGGDRDKKKQALGVSSVTKEGASKLESGSVARAKGNM